MLADTEYGTNWIYFGSDPMNNKAKIIPFEYVHEWQSAKKERWFEVEKLNKRISSKLEEVKKIVKEHYNEANCGLFFSRNIVGDRITTIYDKNGIQIDICYRWRYFEVFGLDLYQQLELEKFYDTLKQEHRKENMNE